MADTTLNPSDAAAIIAAMESAAAPVALDYTPGAAPTFAVPQPVQIGPRNGMVVDLTERAEKYLKRPYRPIGETTLLSVDAMLAHIARHGAPGASVVYVDTTPTKERITAVYDAHESNTVAGHQAFRASFAMKQSEEWKAWTGVDDAPMDAATFADFIDDNVGDVFEGTATGAMGDVIARLGLRQASIAELVTLARGLTVNVAGKVKQAITTSSGEISVQFEETHTDGAGVQLRIANAFLIAVPVFQGTAPMVCLVRLSYRAHAGGITWKLRIHDTARVHQFALAQAVAQIRAGVDPGIPVFEGIPAAAK